MTLHFIQDLDDTRLDPYRNLRNRNPTQYGGRFVVESRWLVERLLASDVEVESIVVDADQLQALPTSVNDHHDIFVIPASHVSQLVGFDFHRGVLGCGRRKPRIDLHQRLEQIVESRWLGVMLVGVQDPENMGLIARTCAALGIDDFFIGPGCVDPYARRVLRVSMGGMLKLRQVDVRDPYRAIQIFSEHAIETIATTLSERSTPIETFVRADRILIVLGNEAEGLPESIQVACHERLRIDMAPGTDSLNVSVAAGIILHHVARTCRYRNSAG